MPCGDLGKFARKGGIKMKQHSVKNCIRTLEKLRDVYNSQLDTSVLVELNAVISDLQQVADLKESEVQLGNLGLRAIQAIAAVISLVSNLKDLMK
jgi:hypothetical protein